MKNCQICSKPLFRGHKFCSRECKSESQKRLISITCYGCNKEFLLWPCLKHEKNYCSRKCYRDSTRKTHLKVCVKCGKNFQVKDYLIKQGFGFYCSNECFRATREGKRVKIVCKECGKIFIKAPSTAVKTTFCSKKCKDDFERDYVSRVCRNCDKTFELPTWETDKGKGSYCSRRCYIQFKGETSIEKIVKDYLILHNIDFDQEVCFGKYHADFQIKGTNILIECDGSYWHNIPGAKEKDIKKDLVLKNKGYEVNRFSEDEIKKTSGSCLAQLSDKIGQLKSHPAES